MNRILVVASFAFTVALAATGCSSTCTHVCEQEIKCEGAAPRACSYECESKEHDADHTGCASQFQAFQACADAPPMDVTYCTDAAAIRCHSENDAYVTCLNAFCAAHAGDGACVALVH